ncbi:hypothetical protein [Aeoliella sp.]|uniref:hypothetical protein n=1 Tax=Aeoliella sp. TaxID=2795800 RepID=UPI003CCBEAFD
MFTIMMAATTLYMLTLAQSMWYLGQLILYDRKVEERFREMERLEREITRAQLICAAKNPDAAEILEERERLRMETCNLPDYFHSRRLWAAQLGGEVFDRDVISEEEDAPCDIAE